jgi:hypothetical protein
MLMTISQGTEELKLGGTSTKKRMRAFELEQFAGRRRSSGFYPDNQGVPAGSLTKPNEGKRLTPGPEFLESSLPRMEILKGLGRKETVQETELKYLSRGATEPTHVKKGGVPPKERQLAKAVEGSGGGFLSNEIFYRTALLREKEGKDVHVGHLHVPYVEPPTGTPASERKHSRLRNFIITTVKKIIALTLPHLGKKIE